MKKFSKTQFREASMPVFLNSGFSFNSSEHGRALFAEEETGDTYTRFSNPNTDAFVERLAELEKCEDGFAFASGMAAVFSVFGALLKSGDHVLASRALFGSSYQILTNVLPRWNISHTFFDRDEVNNLEAKIQSNTKIIFVETPSNPGLDIIDLSALADFKKKHNLILAADNTFATPLIQNPVDYGADLVVHSTTKYIDGQGRTIGGAVLGSKELIPDIRYFGRITGPSMSPFNAWILYKSLETLELRITRQCANAMELAETLENHPLIENAAYPLLKSFPQFELAKKQMRMGGGLVTFRIKGNGKRAFKFMDALNECTLMANLGDSQTIVTHPASTTHSRLTQEERDKMGITDNLIRVSLGLESNEIIKSDILQALDKSNG
jgi:O-succinylhomoserine sulfhydrylase